MRNTGRRSSRARASARSDTARWYTDPDKHAISGDHDRNGKRATCTTNTVSSLTTRPAHFGRHLAVIDPDIAKFTSR